MRHLDCFVTSKSAHVIQDNPLVEKVPKVVVGKFEANEMKA